MVKGVAALHRRFQRIPELVRAAAVEALEKYATEIVGDMKRLAPVLEKPTKDRRPGALRDSIGWTWGDAPKGSLTIGRVQSRKYEGIKVTIYAGTRDKGLGEDDAFYARFVEHGTVNAPAQPFFFVAYRSNKRRARAGLTRAVNKAIRKA